MFDFWRNETRIQMIGKGGLSDNKVWSMPETTARHEVYINPSRMVHACWKLSNKVD